MKKNSQKTFKGQKGIVAKMNDLLVERILKGLYLKISPAEKEKMKKIFVSRDKKQKEEFVRYYLPDFKSVFEREAENLKKEIKQEMRRFI